jgi:hypothetical protein
MDRMHGPIGALLVGATFVCLCLILTALATGYEPDATHALDEVLAHHSSFVHHSRSSDLSYLGTLSFSCGNLTFPWAKRMPQASKLSNSVLLFSSPPTKDEIILRGSNPIRQVKGFGATNNDPDAIGDTNENYDENESQPKSCLSEDLRSAGESGMSAQHSENIFGNNNMNNMNINVRGISVRAVNTMPGGKAVATSNIVIKPVQILICPPEVEEKLK